jgi:autotransporter translocation and assembly factor TamB
VFDTMNLAQGASLLERAIVRASAGKINVNGDLDIAPYAKFDLDDTDQQSNMELELNISGTFTLADNAAIDANFSGYKGHVLGSPLLPMVPVKGIKVVARVALSTLKLISC